VRLAAGVRPSSRVVPLALPRTGHPKTTSDVADEAPEAANSIKTKEKIGGRDRDRTGDPLLAKKVKIQSKSLPLVALSSLKHLLGCSKVAPNVG
jgi:hypothetical protein